MSTNQYLLNAALLAYVLWSNLGTRVVRPRRFLLPVVLVVVAAVGYLRHIPTAGHDVTLEVAGLVAGVLFGAAATLLVKPGRNADGLVTMTAGAGFALLWLVVIGGRMLFAYGADHWFPQAIVRFSIAHQITGAGAWTAAFVLMALAMVLVRVALGAVQAASVPRARVSVPA